MTDYSNQPPENAALTNNKLSLYSPTDSLSDFPVLKAFQQYINEEQAKAQKRMTLVCAVFVVILVLVVSVFTILLVNANRDNSALNGKLMELAMNPSREAAASNGQAMKSITDTITQLQAQMSEQQAKLAKEQQALFEEKLKLLTKPAEKAPEGPSPAQIAAEKKLKEAEEKLRIMNDRLKEEKAKLAREKEAVRKEQVELQRRKLYPEYYNSEGESVTPPSQPAPTTKKVSSPSKRSVQPKKSTQSGYIDYFGDYEDEEVVSTPAPKKVKKTAPKKEQTAPLPAYDNLSLGSDDTLDWQIPFD